jgi:L-ascorbate metabolism protein UlaG (beta-lactamase superfamily)
MTGCAALFLGCASQFGARAKGDSLRKVQLSQHYRDGKFFNLEETEVMKKGSSFTGNAVKWIKGTANAVPQHVLPSEKFDRKRFLESGSGISLVWFGHSTALINIDGYIVLTDPVFSKNPSPVYFGNKAFDYAVETAVEDLPDIDAVVISHDHYDHLDMPTIRKLRAKVKIFLVPLGVAAHLSRWGIPEERIVECDWWQEFSPNTSFRFTAVPARHFSGRGLFNRNETLWCSWVIESGNRKIFFCGDSGYGKHFKQIAERFGSFDLALLECGQYNENWPFIHMNPEETLLAFDDLKGKVLLPIHWGKFKLSLHSWTDPVERIYAGMGSRAVLTPMVGSVVSAVPAASSLWWKDLKEKNTDSAVTQQKGNTGPLAETLN